MKFNWILPIMFLSAISSAIGCQIILEEKGSTPEYLMKSLSQESHKIRSVTPVKEICFKITDKNQTIKGGIVGYLFYGSLNIDMLWIDPQYRKQGYGKKLVQTIEEFAKKRGAKFVTVSTMDWWEAVPFYESLGYSMEYIREGYENNSKQYSLKKNL